MFLPPMHTIEFLGHDLIFMKAEWALATAVWYLFLIGAIMVLANLPQPKPSPGPWALSAVDRDRRAANRRRR